MNNLEVKVGQEIGYYRTHNWSLLSYGTSVVKKINGHGHITLENGMVFDKHHRERVKYGEHTLIDAAKLAEMIARRDEQRNRRDAAHEITKIIENSRTYYDCKLSDESKARVMALLAIL